MYVYMQKHIHMCTQKNHIAMLFLVCDRMYRRNDIKKESQNMELQKRKNATFSRIVSPALNNLVNNSRVPPHEEEEEEEERRRRRKKKRNSTATCFHSLFAWKHCIQQKDGFFFFFRFFRFFFFTEPNNYTYLGTHQNEPFVLIKEGHLEKKLWQTEDGLLAVPFSLLPHPIMMTMKKVVLVPVMISRTEKALLLVMAHLHITGFLPRLSGHEVIGAKITTNSS